MNRLKRLSATLRSRLDNAVRAIENHEAVVDASLEELRRARAEANVRQQRLRRERENQEQRYRNAAEQATTWRRRARDSESEETALECLRRARAADQERDQIARSLDQQQIAESRLQRSVEQLEQRYVQLQAQRESLRSREMAGNVNADGAGTPEIERSLDDWATRVVEAELDDGPITDGDSLAERFNHDESITDLRAELAELRKGTDKEVSNHDS